LRYQEDFRYQLHQRVRLVDGSDFRLPAGSRGTIVRMNVEGPFPYRVAWDDAVTAYGYLMTEQEIEADE
jgi:hypothetical protein